MFSIIQKLLPADKKGRIFTLLPFWWMIGGLITTLLWYSTLMLLDVLFPFESSPEPNLLHDFLVSRLGILILVSFLAMLVSYILIKIILYFTDRIYTLNPITKGERITFIVLVLLGNVITAPFVIMLITVIFFFPL